MPVSLSAYIRTTPTDSTFGVLPAKAASEAPPDGDVTTTQRPYRFAGYHLVYDEHGNILKSYPPNGMPGGQLANIEGTLDLRAP